MGFDVEDSISLSQDYDTLDKFLYESYELYKRGWLRGYLLTKLSTFLTSLSLIFTLFILTSWINWSVVSSVTTTQNVPLASIFSIQTPPSLILVITFIVLFISLFKAVYDVFSYVDYKEVSQKLESIGVRDTHDWRTISRILGNTYSLSDIEIRMRILRKDNYKIGMWKEKVMGVSFYSKALEWSLNTCLWNYVFKPTSGGILVDKVMNGLEPSSYIKFRFQCVGFLSLIVSPFVLMYYAIYVLFGYLEQIKLTPSLISGSTWITSTKLVYRHYNELDHEYEERMMRIAKKLDDYRQASAPTTFVPLVRLSLFILGTLTFTILLLSLVNSNVLTNVYIHNTNLVFVTGLLTAGIIGLTSLLPDVSKLAELPKCVEALNFEGVDIETISKYYVGKWWYFLCEVGGIIIAPCQCLFVLSKNVTDILEYLSTRTVDAGPGTGSVCIFADFRQHINDRHMTGSILAYNKTSSL